MRPSWCQGALLGLVLALVGCGSSDDDGGSSDGQPLSEAAIQSFEGTYELTAFTENAAGCDSEGPSTFDAKLERSFVMVGGEFFGTRYMSLSSCADAAECAAVVAAIRAPSPYSPEYSLTLSTQAGPDELGGLLAMAGRLENGVCTQRDYTAHTLTRDGDTIRVESRLIPLADGPPEDGICWAEPAKQRDEAEGRPCTELQVLAGTKVGPLP